MKASEFKQKVEEPARTLLANHDGPSANTGVGFFIAEMEELFEEWQAEKHECSM